MDVLILNFALVYDAWSTIYKVNLTATQNVVPQKRLVKFSLCSKA